MKYMLLAALAVAATLSSCAEAPATVSCAGDHVGSWANIDEDGGIIDNGFLGLGSACLFSIVSDTCHATGTYTLSLAGLDPYAHGPFQLTVETSDGDCLEAGVHECEWGADYQSNLFGYTCSGVAFLFQR